MLKFLIVSFFEFLTFVLCSVMVLPISILSRDKSKPWVISGHRGKAYADNSGALHTYIVNNTSQEIIWIASNPELIANLTSKGQKVLKRNSISARIAILRAPVLIYSHGEDDLDLFMILWRKVLGKRVYLNHGLNHLKAGDCYRYDYMNANAIVKALTRFLMTDYDHFLATSESERHKFALSQPHNADKMMLGGGSHIDYFFEKSEINPSREIVYFPTFRDTQEGRRQQKEIIKKIVADKQISDYLKANDYKFVFCFHINSETVDIKNIEDCFVFNKEQSARNQISSSCLLISDYSSMFLDYIILDRPLMLFPFDKEKYLSKRNFYVEYSDIGLGPIALDFDRLKDILVNNEWQDIGEYAQRREEWKKDIFPYDKPVYASKCYETIVGLA